MTHTARYYKWHRQRDRAIRGRAMSRLALRCLLKEMRRRWFNALSLSRRGHPVGAAKGVRRAEASQSPSSRFQPKSA